MRINRLRTSQTCFIKLVMFCGLFCLSLFPAYTQDYSGRTEDLTIKIIIISPGDEIYMWWGHIVLIVEDTRENRLRLFEWGTFTYPGNSFILDFINGQIRYFCTSMPLDMERFINGNWEIRAYSLNLDRNAKEIILNYAENNVLPENCYYDYRLFSDNCSTRIRDIIDMGTGGQFKAAFDGVPGQYSLRQHIRRYTWFKPVSDWFLCLLMGHNFDKKISPWEAMFLPVEVARNIGNITYFDSSGMERKLVDSVQVFDSSKKIPAIVDKPPLSWPFSLLAGVLAAVLLLFIDVFNKKRYRNARILLALIQSLLGLILGLTGCVLVFSIFFMNGEYFHMNSNLLFVNPLFLAIIPLVILSGIKKTHMNIFGKLLRMFWTYVFVAGIITAFLCVLPFFYQQNQGTLGFILPIAFALSYMPEKTSKLLALHVKHGI